MRSRNYYRTRAIVRAIALAGAITIAIALAGFVWWTGNGICLGTMSKCVGI